jgi:hypothetical protein
MNCFIVTINNKKFDFNLKLVVNTTEADEFDVIKYVIDKFKLSDTQIKINLKNQMTNEQFIVQIINNGNVDFISTKIR